MRRTRALARGQALVEFALVAPLIFMFLFGVLTLSAIAWDGQVADHAARVAAEEANASMGPVNARFAAEPQVATAWVQGRNDSAFSNGCRQAASRSERANGQPDTNLARRLGWDWGCLPGPGGSSDIDQPLRAALDEVAVGLDTGGFIAGTGRSTLTACYAVWNGTAATCVYTVTVTNGGAAVIARVSGVARETTFAPSFVIVRVQIEALSLAGGPTVMIDREAQVILDRWLPPCPAGTTALGTCGGIF